MREIYKNGDSIAAKFSQASHFKNRAGTLYKIRMQSTYKNLEMHAKASRWGKNVTPENITEKQIRGYVQGRIDAGIAARTIQNEISHLRRSLEGVGRSEFAKINCKNSAIGVPGASRIGTGRVIDNQILASAREKSRYDTRALLDLQRCLGLRIREAVVSGVSLKIWLKSIENGNVILTVTDGTKGGRLRDVYIRPDNVEPLKNAISACLGVLSIQGKLVESPSLKSAMETHSDRLARVGIKGASSSHSLRRAFAMDQFLFYQRQGHDEKKALSLTSRDLGHGDSRGRWVFNNYLRATLESE